MIELRSMSAADYEDFLALAIPTYAESNVTSGRWPKKGALEKSRQSFGELLPQGLQTPEHLLFVITRGGSHEKVGYLWVKLETDQEAAFIYQIDVLPEHQGRGYGTQALRDLERRLKTKGIQKLALHVFGFNEGAIRLYKKIGFQVASLNMHKAL